MWYEMNKGYQEYRDFARHELQNGYERNPAISVGSEIIGSAISPIAPFKARGYTGSLGKTISHPEDIARTRQLNTIGTGVINGVGYTNENTPKEYTKNIIGSTIKNAGGTMLGNKLFGSSNNMYRVGRGVMNSTVQSIPYGYDYFRNKNKDDE